MRRLIVLALVVLLASGCCVCRDGYDKFLGQINDNLKGDLLPKFNAYVDADQDRSDDLRANDKKLGDDMVFSIERVIEEGLDADEKAIVIRLRREAVTDE